MAIGPLLILGCATGVLHRVEAPPLPASAESASTTASRARYHYVLAELALARGDAPGAEAALNTALLHDRDSPWLWLALGEVARASGRDPLLERARVLEATRLAPRLSAAWVALGHAEARLGNGDAAAAAWRTAVELGAGSPALGPLALLLLARKDPTAGAAIEAWSAVPEEGPATLRERGHACLQAGDLGRAVDDLGRALLDDANDARLLDEFIGAVTGSGRLRAGLLLLDELQRIAPANQDLLLRAFHLATRAGDPVRAREALLNLDAASGGTDAQVKVWLAEAWSAAGDHDRALATFESAAMGVLPDAAFHRARLLRASGRPASALLALQIPVAGANRVDAQALQVRLLIETGKPGEARAVAEASLRSRPDDYVLLGALVAACAAEMDREGMLAAVDRMAGLDDEARARTRARSLAGIGDLDGALLALRSSGLDHMDTWILGGALLGQAGRRPEAVVWMQRAVDRFPRAANLRAALGMTLSADGQDAEALIAMREALELDEGEPEAARYYSGVVVAPEASSDRLAQARGYLLAALERRPADTGLLDGLARVEMDLGHPARAAALWEEARRQSPSDETLALRLAAAWEEVGRSEDARRLRAAFP